MININEDTLKSRDNSFIRKIRALRDPNLYLAQDLRDFRENIPNIDYPWYKGFPMINLSSSSKRAYIFTYNVGIDLLNDESKIKYFLVHDKTDKCMMAWGCIGEFTEPLKSFEEIQEEQGLKTKDLVYEIFFEYLPKYDLPIILEVSKNKRRRRIVEKENLTERLKNLLPVPNIEPLIQPV